MDARPESPTTPSRKFVAWLADPQAKIAVTGASGWIGRAVVHLALAAGLDPQRGRLRLFGSRPRGLDICGRRLGVEALAGAAPLGGGDWIVLHLAIVGAERVAGADPAITQAVNDALLADAIRLAGSGTVRRFVFSSSGAAGRAAVAAEPHPYGAMKLAHETALAEWAARSRQPLLTARVFNLGGPYINHVERYALGDFIQAFRREGRIRVAAERGVFRSYVHVLELARVLFHEALDETRTDIAFDTCGRETVEMGDLARTVCEVLEPDEFRRNRQQSPHPELVEGRGVHRARRGLVLRQAQDEADWKVRESDKTHRALGDADCRIERPEIGADAPDWYVGSGEAYRAALFRSGAEPGDLPTIIRDTAAYLARTAI